MREAMVDSLHEPSKITVTRKSSRYLMSREGRGEQWGHFEHDAAVVFKTLARRYHAGRELLDN
jgi:hypothetical protein